MGEDRKFYNHTIGITIYLPFITTIEKPTSEQMKERVMDMDSSYFKDSISQESFDVVISESEGPFENEEETID